MGKGVRYMHMYMYINCSEIICPGIAIEKSFVIILYMRIEQL